MTTLTAERPSILLVDDESAALGAFRRELSSAPFDILCASGGGQALAMLWDHPVEIVLSDYRMPDLNGIDLLERVATQFPQTRRVLISAYADTDVIADAYRRARIHRLLKKPWDSKELRRVLEEEAGLRPLEADPGSGTDPRRPASAPGPLMILHDDLKMLIQLGRYAGQCGLAALPLAEGKDLLKWIGKVRPSVLFTPLYGENVDALEVLRTAREAAVPVIIVAPSASSVTLLRVAPALEEFVRQSVGFLVEPFSLEDFVEAVHDRLKGSR